MDHYQLAWCMVLYSIGLKRVCSHENVAKTGDKENIVSFSDTMKWFVKETLSTAILDPGCTKSV